MNMLGIIQMNVEEFVIQQIHHSEFEHVILEIIILIQQDGQIVILIDVTIMMDLECLNINVG
jgi:hypothetical protein